LPISFLEFFIKSRGPFGERTNPKQACASFAFGHVGNFFCREFQFHLDVTPHPFDADVVDHDTIPIKRILGVYSA
jgi:hypothetical protein